MEQLAEIIVNPSVNVRDCPLPGSIADREAMLLAPYAMHSSQSQGRVHPQSLHPYRGPFQRDRDRILHSSAFRRLSGKTQVFTGIGDYHRTRLTHTMEVTSIARTIGRALRLNEDLIEALALLHDIGHPPFGHAGEDALNAILGPQGTFSHNRHALTLVEEIEQPYPNFCGLNLSLEIIEGQRARVAKDGSWQLLEVQVVDLADSITYDAHDLDDGVKLGWLSMEQLLELPLVKGCHEAVQARFGQVGGEIQRQALVHELINCQVLDVINQASSQLKAYSTSTIDDIRRDNVRFGPSESMRMEKEELERFLYRQLYRHERMVAARAEAQSKLKEMARIYISRPHTLPELFRARISTHGGLVAAVDYLAGMTDRFCLHDYERLVQETL